MKKSQTRRSRASCQRSICPIANILDIAGDKWTLLIVRDLLYFGKSRYQELSASPEKIPTNILADRLKRLERDGLIVKKPYQTNPPRYAYALTPRGVDLRSVLEAMLDWSIKHVPGTAKKRPTFKNPKTPGH